MIKKDLNDEFNKNKAKMEKIANGGEKIKNKVNKSSINLKKHKKEKDKFFLSKL